jgi:hypothetical protein
MDLTKAILPESVEVSGRLYRVHTEHSYWFRFYQILEQEKKYLHEFDFMYIDTRKETTLKTYAPKKGIFNRLLKRKTVTEKKIKTGSYIPEDRQAGVDALVGFFYEKKELPRVDGESGPNVLDYTIDADLLYAGILQCYGIDLMEKQYHWHIVRALIGGLEGTKLNTIIGYRCAKPGKNRELALMQAMWALPEKISAEDKEALERFHAQFK